MSNIRKTKKCCKQAKVSLTRANIRYVKHPKNQKVRQTSKKQLNQGKHQIYRTPEKLNSAANIRKAAFPARTYDMSNIRKKTKSAANIRKEAFPGQTSDMSNIRKTKKCCKQAKTSLTRANIRYVKYPKNQKVLQTCENQLYQGKHPICQRSEKPKSAANIRKPFYHGKHPTCQTSEKPKSAANIRKAAFPGQTSVMSNIRKTKKCCIHGKTSLTRANIRYIEHPKNQKVLQTSENQLYQGEHSICQTSKKLKSAANMRKPASPGQTSDMSNIRKTKTWCKKAKTSLTRANIRYVEHPKNQKVLQSSKNQLVQGEHPICQHPKKQKVLQSSKNQLYHGKHPNVKHPKNQKVLETSEKQIFQGKHPTCQTTKKPKSAANMRKPALPGQTSDLSNIRKTKKCCKHPKTSFTRATSDMSNIRKTKKCCKHPKTSFTMPNIRYVKHSKNQKVLETSEKQTFQGKPPICQTSEKQKSAAIMRKPALPGQTSDMSNIRKTKKCCKPAKTSFTRANIRYVKHPKNQKLLQTSKKQLFQGNNLISQTSEKPKKAANMQKPALPGQTSDISMIRKTKKCCNYPKTSFTMANIRCVKHLKNQNCCKHPKTSFTMANIR